MRRGLLYVLFFLSGASALVYELVWQRLLHLVFGVSTLAVSAVLAAFMGGLALGGLVFGRVADRSRRPLRLYAILEVGIAVTALLVPIGFALLTHVYTSLYATLQPGPWQATLLRFVLALAVLLVPATLIGGTAPVMARLTCHSPERLSGQFSLLYGINTLGAVTGAVLTGFVLLRYLGMAETLWLAAGVNGIVALTALRMRNADRGLRIESPSADSAAAIRESVIRNPQFAIVCAALTGAVATGLEVAWTRILGIFTSNSAYAFALILAVMLAGLGVGGLLQSLWARRAGDGWRRLAVCQWLLAGLTLVTLPYFRTAPEWLARGCTDGSAGALFVGELALTAAALFLPALLMGLSFPLLVGSLANQPQRFGQRLGRLYAGNTLGCVAGAFVAGFVLIPRLGLQSTLGVFAGSSLAVGLIAWGCAARPSRMVRGLVAATVLAASVCGWLRLPHGGYLRSPVEGQRQLLYYREGNNATVSVIAEAGGSRHLFVDGQPVAGTGATDVVDQKMLAHLPLLLHPDPHRALTVGFGSGGTSYSMTLHGVDVDCVEIEPAVPAAADQFASENHGVRAHPRFHLILDDARSWLRVAPVRYDAIVTDCTNIQYKSNGDLYTVEYFRLMRDRLTEQGIAAAWVPANGIDPADLKTLLRSFRAVFPHTSVWFMSSLPTDFLVVIGTPGKLEIDLDRWAQRMQVPEVRADLASVGLADPCRLLYTLLTSDAGLDRYLGDAPVHTDDRPILSYSTYAASFRRTIAVNLVQLLTCREDAAHYVHGPVNSTLLLRQYAASNEVLLGHVAFHREDPHEALYHYVAAAQLLPGDPVVGRLVVSLYACVPHSSGSMPK